MLTLLGFILIFIGVILFFINLISGLFKKTKHVEGRFLTNLLADTVGFLVSITLPLLIALLGWSIVYYTIY